jgi:uncharacterized membrane protein
MIWINLLYLLLVSFLPFATDMVGDHENLVLPCEIYGATLLALSAIGFVHTRYLAAHPALATPEFTPDVVAMFDRRAVVFALVPLASMAIAFLSTHVALYVYVLLAAAHLLSKPIIPYPDGDGERRDPGSPTS